jgi:hypothetical protein
MESKVRLRSCLVMMLWMLCAMAGAATSEPDNREVQQAALLQRVTAKWGALLRKDFAAAYAFTSPAYRQLYSLEAFKSKFGGNATWRRIEILDVAFKDDNAATVGINLHFVYYQLQPDKALDMTTYIQEPWVRVDDNWWSLVRE